MSNAVEDLKRALEARRRRLDDEIRNYPTPIPRCDAQFNRPLRAAHAHRCGNRRARRTRRGRYLSNFATNTRALDAFSAL
jgi:hypothetical protein